MSWTNEETQYYRALLAWEPKKEEPVKPQAVDRRPPVGEFRFVIMGAEGCGKTSILERVRNGLTLPRPESDPRLGSQHRITLNDKPYLVETLELPAAHLISASVQRAVHITEAAVLCYDVTSRSSFAEIQGLREAIQTALVPDPKMGTWQQQRREYGLVLVGNKCDVTEGAREVSWYEGRKLALEFQVPCAFVEASARSGERVERLFPDLAARLLELRRLTQAKKTQMQRLSAVMGARKERYGMEGPIGGDDGDGDSDGDSDGEGGKGLVRWRVWSRARPWFRRRQERKAVAQT
ncbi:P-loop containing nucleoside triphosphate hydrolase protein [Xylariaceae sp. FL0016]|nr:P-loop containing nucleoside triphosphate hydrolase protein [Xylariaceae sp. FL0016]